MQKYLTLIAILSSLFNFAQPNTEVFLCDLKQENGTFQLSNVKNISENEGYDNQPSFLDSNTILFAGTRNAQTDIVKYNISNGGKIWVCETEGGEYSPLKIPNQNAVSAIRLEKDGTQRLQKYNLENGNSEVLIEDIVIGYHVWFNADTLISSVLEDGGLSLYLTNIKEKENQKIEANIGRSLHKIPNSNLVSFISKEKDSIWEIKSLNPSTGEIKVIFETLPNSEDMCWTPKGYILMGNAENLYMFDPKHNESWVKIADLTHFGITNITRLVVSQDGNKIALVGEPINN